jgi:hypothetical protein
LGSERAPTSSDLEGESSTHCFWNCDFDTTAVAHFCINSTATSAANFLQSESPLQQGLLQGTGTTVDSLSNSFTTVFSCTASCDVCSDPGTVQQAVFNQQSCSGRSQCSNESHSNSFFGGLCNEREFDQGPTHDSPSKQCEFKIEPTENEMTFGSRCFASQHSGTSDNLEPFTGLDKPGAGPRAMTLGAGPQKRACSSDQSIGVPNGLTSLVGMSETGAVPRATTLGASPHSLAVFGDDEFCWSDQMLDDYEKLFMPPVGAGGQAKEPEFMVPQVDAILADDVPGADSSTADFVVQSISQGSSEGESCSPDQVEPKPRSQSNHHDMFPKDHVETSLVEPMTYPISIDGVPISGNGVLVPIHDESHDVWHEHIDNITCDNHDIDMYGHSQCTHDHTRARTNQPALTLSSRKTQVPVQSVLKVLVCLMLVGLPVLSSVCLATTAVADEVSEGHDIVANVTKYSSASHHPRSLVHRLSAITAMHPIAQVFVLSIPILMFVCHMFPGAGGNAFRTPPAWGPEQESTYPFRQWSRDVLLWSIASDMEPARKAAAVMLTLRGAARELSRQIPPQAVVAGGLINGVQVDPLTYVMHALQERFGNLGEEIRVQSITELMSFHRKGNEPVDSLLVRFDSIRSRAAEQGGAVVGVQGVAWILLRAIGITDQQLIQLLAPFNGLFPANEAELNQLKTSLRRMGHILERTPGNLREGLRSSTNNPSSAFLANADPWNEQPSHDQWNRYDDHASHEWAGQSAFNASASSQPSQPSQPSHEAAYAMFEDEDIDTDSNTSSGECSSVNADGQDPNRVAQTLFWAYRQAKHKWRKYMGKSTRAVRRYARRFNKYRGKGKGKKGNPTFTVGKGKGKKGKHPVTAMLAEMDDGEVQLALPAFRGHRSPGKGKGRRSNPKGPDGQTMRCFECGSTEHLAGACPRRASSSGSNQATTFFTRATDANMSVLGPLSGIIDETDVFHMTSADNVTFATHADNPESEPNTYHAFMMSSGETDPLEQNDPWSSATTHSWSVPTSAPRSFGPITSAGRPTTQASWFPFGAFGRRSTTSEPAISHSSDQSRVVPPSTPRTERPLNPGYVPPEPRPFPVNAPGNPSQPVDEPPAEATAGRNQPSMQWASMSQMPAELRDLLPFPVLAPPTVPAFADRPEFEFLRMDSQQQLPHPPSLREPQLSMLEGPVRPQIEDFHFVQQHVAYHRHQTNRDMPMNRPAVQMRSNLDRQYRAQMFEFHQTQQHVERSRKQKKERSRQPRLSTEESEYDGAPDVCPLCREKFEVDESVLRLVCKHLYHVECWTEYMCHGERLVCPVCRGGCHVVARYRIPADQTSPPLPPSRPVTPERSNDRDTPDAFNIFTPPPGRAPRGTSDSSAVGTPFFSPDNQEAYPWWPSESFEPTAAYHSISIPDRAGIIIDPGAYTNLIGENTARAFAQKAIENGHKPRQWKMKPMYVQGVGEGQQKCEWTVSIPIACKLSVGGKTVCLNYFEAPVVGGSGARLPALLGLRSLTSLSATLCMHENNEALYVPLPGGPIEDLHQCRKCPLSKAPSGHLIMTIDHWRELAQDSRAGVQPKPMVLHVDPLQPSTPSTMQSPL